MLDFDELGEQVAQTIMGNSAFMAALGTGGTVEYVPISFPDESNPEDRIRELAPPGAILTHVALDIFSRQNGIVHRYALSIRPKGKSGALIKALRDGSVAGGSALKFYEFQPEGHAIDITGAQARQLVIDQDRFRVIEFYEVFLQVTERGVDNV